MSINYKSNYLLPNISDQLCAYQKDRVSLMIRDFMNIPKWRSHLIRQNRATYSNLENHLIQITEPGNPI